MIVVVAAFAAVNWGLSPAAYVGVYYPLISGEREQVFDVYDDEGEFAGQDVYKPMWDSTGKLYWDVTLVLLDDEGSFSGYAWWRPVFDFNHNFIRENFYDLTTEKNIITERVGVPGEYTTWDQIPAWGDVGRDWESRAELEK